RRRRPGPHLVYPGRTGRSRKRQRRPRGPAAPLTAAIELHSEVATETRKIKTRAPGSWSRRRVALVDVPGVQSSVLDQVVGDHLPVAVGRAPLRAEQAERRGQVQQPRGEEVPRLAEQLAIRGAPVVELEEDIAQLEDRVVRDPPIGEESLDPLARGSGPG